MRISKRTREEAILILDIAASHATGNAGSQRSVDGVIRDMDADRAVYELIWLAYDETNDCGAQGRGDAAGLLRDGWRPGDTVVRL